MELPLQKLGVHPGRNPTLFRFLDLCAEISGITKVDHCTFRCPPDAIAAMQEHWEQQGFTHHADWTGGRHPAHHIAVVRGRPSGYPWEEMVELVSRTADASDNEECWLQQIALNVSAQADLSGIRVTLQAHGVRFMTDILKVDEPDGSGVRQLFTAPSSRGFFIELIQRLPSVEGVPYSGFDLEIIDELYDALDSGDTVWHGLPTGARDAHERWIPTTVAFDLPPI